MKNIIEVDGKEFRVRYKHYRIPSAIIAELHKLHARTPRKGRPYPEWLFAYGTIRNAKGKYFHGRFHFSHPWPNGGLTVCDLYNPNTGELFVTAKALCSLSDTFSYKTGRDLSKERALESIKKETQP